MTKAPLLALFSDFGADGPYCGQVFAKWAELAPGIPVVNLFANSPAFDIEAGAHLLFAYTRQLPKGSVIEAVVDPGVGGARDVCIIQADDYWFCGPVNGLFDVIIRRSRSCRAWLVSWRPEQLSNTFHGRDLFAPLAARLAINADPYADLCADPDRVAESNHFSSVDPQALLHPLVVADPAWRVILVDVYGNLITGVPQEAMAKSASLRIKDVTLQYAPQFDAVAPGQAFWYINSNGLVEVAANQMSACKVIQCGLGQEVKSFGVG